MQGEDSSCQFFVKGTFENSSNKEARKQTLVDVSEDVPLFLAAHQNLFSSTCRYWLQGTCNRGLACRFAHPVPNDRSFPLGEFLQHAHPSLSSTEIAACQRLTLTPPPVKAREPVDLKISTAIRRELRKQEPIAPLNNDSNDPLAFGQPHSRHVSHPSDIFSFRTIETQLTAIQPLSFGPHDRWNSMGAVSFHRHTSPWDQKF